MTVEDLQPGRQYQFWVTAVTSVGEGKSSNVVTQTPSDRVPARVTSLGHPLYLPLRSKLSLPCRFVGASPTIKKWYLDGVEEDWTRESAAGGSVFGGDSALERKSVSKSDEGNYTCHVENAQGSDRVTYSVRVQGE